ncbi:MAG: sodium:alanine symporter family protein [Coprococcus sp.]|nr:sodium:alanine symporter family protein [Coprococcus sp.]
MWGQISLAVETIRDVVWGWPMIILLLGTHIFMTFRTGFIQKKIFTGIRLSVAKDEGVDGDISQFGALATALASTIGTGNIVGVGTAVVLGGPGAVLWCWLTGVFGIATKYAEALIAVKYRIKDEDGIMRGGAMYALEYGLKWRRLGKFLGKMFAFAAVCASFGIGCAAQVNAIATVCRKNMGASSRIVGIIAAVCTALVIFGGVRAIAGVCEKLVPLMAASYIFGCAAILWINRDFIIPALFTIVRLAFTPGAAAGGLVGGGMLTAMRYGIARGLFSNESGMGSAPIAAAAARTRNPVRQALVSSTGTFWDTVVLCMLTGLVLVTSIMKSPKAYICKMKDGGELTSLAFGQIPGAGPVILVVGIISFAYSTVIGWAYYGECCIKYLAGKKALVSYRILYVLTAAFAPVVSLDLIWLAADILNALMAVPNLTAVLLLSPVIVSETGKYRNDLNARSKEQAGI